jgi:CubicO group peptidase (beta-lactamase class C family)
MDCDAPERVRAGVGPGTSQLCDSRHTLLGRFPFKFMPIQCGGLRATLARMRFLLCGLAYLSLGIGPLCSAAPKAGEARAATERLLARFGNSSGPGCAAGVLLNGVVVFEGAVGTSDGAHPLTSVTPVYVASVSKQFTAAAVYRLAQQGRIDLNEPIQTKIPELKHGAIKVQQLLNHTSGLRDYGALQEVLGSQAAMETRDVIRLLSAQRGNNFEPGADYEYSNSDYVLLAALVERASGTPFDEFVKRELFDPLGMDRSWFQSQRVPLYEPARGFAVRNGQLVPASNIPRTNGDGGMYSTVSDLLRWMRALEGAGGAPLALKQIQKRARLGSGESIPHASGLFRNQYKGRPTISHDGAVAGFQADVVHFPEQHLSVVCLCNRGNANATSLSREIADVYLGTGGERISKVTPGRRRPISADLAGSWRSRQGFVLTTKIEGDHLLASLAGETHSMSFGRNPREFSTQSETLRLFLRRRGKDAVTLFWEGDRPTSFERIRPAAVTPGLGRYAGRFVNSDLDVAWDLIVENEALVITTAAGWRIPLARSVDDHFEVGPWQLEFERGGTGISGFRLHRERVWNLPFEREAKPALNRKTP